jgi:hypothetical protein
VQLPASKLHGSYSFLIPKATLLTGHVRIMLLCYSFQTAYPYPLHHQVKVDRVFVSFYPGFLCIHSILRLINEGQIQRFLNLLFRLLVLLQLPYSTFHPDFPSFPSHLFKLLSVFPSYQIYQNASLSDLVFSHSDTSISSR